MKPGGFLVGEWLVTPELDRVERNGRVARLRPKTMQVLAALAERAGEVVSREDLQRRAWRDVHVSEESLSHCIAEIRGVFGDDAKAPAYVETVAKHGYRLIAPVSAPAPAHEAAPSRSGGAHPGPLPRLTPRAAAVVCAAVVIAVSAGAGVRRIWPPPAKDTHLIVLADWANRTGDAVFDETPRQAFAAALGEAPEVRVVPRERIAYALRLMRQPPEARLDAVLARQVCRRIGADAMADGEIARVGEQYVLIVEATACSSEHPLIQVQATARGKNDVLAAIRRVARGLQDQLEGAPTASGGSPRRLDDVTTADLNALHAFALANDALSERKVAEAIALLEHAIELDPGFALAHSRLGSTFASLREWKRANEHRNLAMGLSERLTERERLYVTATFKLGQGRMAEAEDTLRTWARLYPGDQVPLNWLAIVHLNRGEQAEALSLGLAAIRGDPSPGTLVNLAAVYLNLGRAADARSLTDGLKEPGFRYLLAFLDSDPAEMARLQSAVAAGSVEELDMRAREAQAAMAAGRLRDGRLLVGRAETLGLQLGLLELTAQVLATHAVWESEVGDPSLAQEMATAALSMGDNSSTRALAVLALARCRAVKRALALLKHAEGAPAEIDPAIAAGSARKLAAAVALARSRPEEALAHLEDLRPYEDGGVANHVALRGDVAELGVFHLRGLARLALNQGEEAAAEFQTIVDRRGVSPLSPYVALAPLNLARAHAVAGNLPAACREYEAFLKRWGGADPEASLMAEARREYQRVAAAAAPSR